MTVLSHTEENYIKCIFSLSETKDGNISTNAIADRLGTTAASVTDMIKRLAGKSIVHYEKYYGVSLTEAGQQVAVNLIRRHRLWETFLVDKLGFHLDEVHDMAEELEHVASDLLTERLDAFLGKPRFDPHGDPIPDSKGNISYHEDVTLDKVDAGKKGIIVGVTDHTPAFLQFLEKHNLVLHTPVFIESVEDYDNSRNILIAGKETMAVSQKVAGNLLVRLVH